MYADMHTILWLTIMTGYQGQRGEEGSPGTVRLLFGRYERVHVEGETHTCILHPLPHWYLVKWWRDANDRGNGALCHPFSVLLLSLLLSLSRSLSVSLSFGVGIQLYYLSCLSDES